MNAVASRRARSRSAHLVAIGLFVDLALASHPAAAGSPDRTSAATDPGRTPLAEVAGETIYVDEVEGALALRIYQRQLDIYSLLRAEAERRIEARLLAGAAAERGLTVEALLTEVEAGGPAIDEAAVDAYLAEHPSTPRLAPDRARERVRNYLTEREKLARRIAYLEALREAAGVRILLEQPTRPRTHFDTAELPARGPADAPVTIVHFASLGSRNAARSAAKLERLAEAFPGKIRRVHVHLLNDRDEAGLYAARIATQLVADANAASQPASSPSFWRFHDALFAREGKLDVDAIEAVAREIGLAGTEIEEATRSSDTLGRVKREIDRAGRAGIPREPSLFVNGLFVSGLVPYEEMRELVAGELGE